MTDQILSKFIQTNNPQEIEKYVKNKLPNNPQSLQKIYHELASFSQTLNDIIEGKKPQTKLIENQPNKQAQIKRINNLNNQSIKKYSSFKQLPRKSAQQYFQHHKQQNITKRQQSLIRSLKQKGFRGNSIDIPLGLQIIKKQQKKISQPLQLNVYSQLRSKQSFADITKSIKRFNLNTNFYSNNIQDGHIDEEKYFDKEMKRFIDIRNKSLDKINKRHDFSNDLRHINSKKFSHVQSLLYKKTGSLLGLDTFRTTISKTDISKIPASQKIKIKKYQQYSSNKVAQTDQLIKYCTDTLQQSQENQNRPKSLLYETKKYQSLRQNTQSITNSMRKLQQKLQFDGLQLDNKSEQIDNLAKNYGKNKLIDKYTLNYMKLIMDKHKDQMILSNRKDLINNEPKFKQLIAEHLDK